LDDRNLDLRRRITHQRSLDAVRETRLTTLTLALHSIIEIAKAAIVLLRSMVSNLNL